VLLVVSDAYDLKCNFRDAPTQQAIVNITVHVCRIASASFSLDAW
jgi:hypothetical protein